MQLEKTTIDELNAEFAALVEFGKRSRTRVGFATMDADGNPDEPAGAQLWINCRMTHIFCLALLRGDESAREYAEHGVTSLLESFHDKEFGGFFDAISLEDASPLPGSGERKLAYAHAFVLLAASSGIQAGIPRAQELFDLADEAHEQYFWEPEFGLVRESYNRALTESEDYRGANANMHTLEACLAAWDATSDPRWLAKSGEILAFILGQARALDWRVPEHFDSFWQLLKDFNHDRPADPFRPYGVTPGHGIEWSRLTLHYWAAMSALVGDISGDGVISGDGAGAASPEAASSGAALDPANPNWLASLPVAARALFTQAVADGWNADGEPGLVYTTDYDGTPVVHERMHWTVCEGIGAAAALATYAEQVGDAELAEQMHKWFETFHSFARENLIEAPGRWFHELDRNNKPSGVTWPGKPDVYHAAQAMLMPQLGLTPTFAGALAS